ncbi:hypothetical protein [Variovorax saccharolyticus]|uniref:hypothetical protein n=1 Tax=Variovorax saccharolyticus TaxID=3053516 RepID=UPI002574D131|nr:hypothetical protein [Variovorax sp. J22R187]MDM0022733.1 hypothetical protein [Variovorax sp. J22R187]
MPRRIESVQDLAQLPQPELLPCLMALRKAIEKARQCHADDCLHGRSPAEAPLRFDAFEWGVRRKTGDLDQPIRLDPSTPIDEIPLRREARAALNSLGIYYVEDLSAISEQELLVKNSIGRQTAGRLRAALLRVGMDFLPNDS